MAVPKGKTSRMKMGHRRSSHTKERVSIILDNESGEFRRPHHIDLSTGKYAGRQVLKVVKVEEEKVEE